MAGSQIADAAEAAASEVGGSETAFPADELADATTVVIPATHLSRVRGGSNAARTTLIVVGMPNVEAVTDAAADNLLVAGLQRADEWHDVNANPHPDLLKLVPAGPGAGVVLWLGNPSADATVWTQMHDLGVFLRSQPGQPAIRYVIDTGGTEAAGLLGMHVDRRDREEVLAGVLKNAAIKLGRRPAAAGPRGRSSIAPTVDPVTGTIWAGDAESRQVLMEAAVQVLRTEKLFDDLKDPAGRDATYVHTLEVTYLDAEGRGHSHVVPGVLDAQLRSPRSWLNRVPGGTKIAVAGANDAVCSAIENAIRTFRSETVIETPALCRTGWFEIEGKYGFAHPGGWNNAEGRTDLARSHLPTNLRRFELKDPSEFTPQQEQAAATNSLSMMEDLAVPVLWYGLFGTFMHAAAGLGVGAVPYIAGKKGSGKTKLAEGIAAHAGDSWTPMSVIDSTPKNIAKTGIGLHDLFWIVDDARKRRSVRAADAQDESMEYLVRAGYEGGKARHVGNIYDQTTKRWEQGSPDLSSPALAIVGEKLPMGEEYASSLERFFPVEIEPGVNIFRSGNSRLFEEAAENGLPSLHFAAFLRWVARGMDAAGGKDPWVAEWSQYRTNVVGSRAHLPVSIRVREVAARPEIGMALWLTYLLELGVINHDRFHAILADVRAAITATATHHGTVNVQSNDVGEWEAAVLSLRATVNAGQTCIMLVSGDKAGLFGVTEDPNDTRQVLGYLTTGHGGLQYLAFTPRDVLSVLCREQRFRDLKESELLAAFKPVSLRDPGKNYKSVTVNGLRGKYLALPVDVWTGERESASDGTVVGEVDSSSTGLWEEKSR